jgi:hypothetical protein
MTLKLEWSILSELHNVNLGVFNLSPIVNLANNILKQLPKRPFWTNI